MSKFDLYLLLLCIIYIIQPLKLKKKIVSSASFNNHFDDVHIMATRKYIGNERTDSGNVISRCDMHSSI